MHDADHAFFAAHVDYFISGDLRFRKKCEAVYSYYGISTVVVALEDAESLIFSLVESGI
jgi:hypothetical protein